MMLAWSTHKLETRTRVNGKWTSWRSTLNKHLSAARALAADGRAMEAVAMAFDITANTDGHCKDVDFRVVSRTVAVTVFGGEISDDRLQVED